MQGNIICTVRVRIHVRSSTVSKKHNDLWLPYTATLALAALTSPSFSCIPVRVIQSGSTSLPSFALYSSSDGFQFRIHHTSPLPFGSLLVLRSFSAYFPGKACIAAEDQRIRQIDGPHFKRIRIRPSSWRWIAGLVKKLAEMTWQTWDHCNNEKETATSSKEQPAELQMEKGVNPLRNWLGTIAAAL